MSKRDEAVQIAQGLIKFGQREDAEALVDAIINAAIERINHWDPPTILIPKDGVMHFTGNTSITTEQPAGVVVSTQPGSLNL